MIDIKIIREQMGILEDSQKKRNAETAVLYKIKDLDDSVRGLKSRSENLKEKRNELSKKIGVFKQKGEDASELMAEVKSIPDKIKEMDKELVLVENELKSCLLSIPNIVDSSVPSGRTDEDNEYIREYGTKREFDFELLPHVEQGEKLGILDLKRSAKIAGSNFPLLKGPGAVLERALINFMLDIHTKDHGYQEIVPPYMVNSSSLTGTGQLPKFEEDLFKIEGLDYYMVPTAEVPLTNIHRDEILDYESLPVKYTAYTPCFRSEAGSWGKDTRGLIRQHQFNKVELMQFVKPEKSYQGLEELLMNASDSFTIIIEKGFSSDELVQTIESLVNSQEQNFQVMSEKEIKNKAAQLSDTRTVPLKKSEFNAFASAKRKNKGHKSLLDHFKDK